MYDPILGRWLEQDPIGLDAGDMNLYRFVKDNPVNEVDPSGLLGILFDGSGYSAMDGSIIATFNQPLAAGRIKEEPLYIRTDIGNLWKKVNGAEDQILKALKKNPKEPIIIIGWSRGGMAALALAKKLAKHKPPIKIKFLGLIDPTAPVKKYTEDKNFLDLDITKCDDNIENAALIVRDGKHDGNMAENQVYRIFFKVRKIEFSEKTRVLVNKELPMDHAHTGFSREVGNLMWDAAKKAGVELPADNPFMQDDYNETPRGGRGFFGNAEILIRSLKLVPD